MRLAASPRLLLSLCGLVSLLPGVSQPSPCVDPSEGTWGRGGSPAGGREGPGATAVPPFPCPAEPVNLARFATVSVEPPEITCGSPAETFCAMANPYLCDECDSETPELAHPPSLMTDTGPGASTTRWQSSTWAKLAAGPGSPHATVSLSWGGIPVELSGDVVLGFGGRRPPPRAMLVERSRDGGRTWRVWQWFASDCRRAFGLPARGDGQSVRPGDALQAFCTERYSRGFGPGDGVARVEMSRRIALLRPAGPRSAGPEALREFLTATDVRVRLLEPPSGDAEFDPDSLSRYYYSIADVVLPGRCACPPGAAGDAGPREGGQEAPVTGQHGGPIAAGEPGSREGEPGTPVREHRPDGRQQAPHTRLQGSPRGVRRPHFHAGTGRRHSAPGQSERRPGAGVARLGLRSETRLLDDTGAGVGLAEPDVFDTGRDRPGSKTELRGGGPDGKRAEPGVPDTEPDAPDAEPDGFDVGPDRLDPKPDLLDTRPAVTRTEPDISVTEPDDVDIVSTAADAQPDVVNTDLERLNTELDVKGVESDAADTGSVRLDPEPDLVDTELDVKPAGPDVPDPEPDARRAMTFLDDTAPGLGVTGAVRPDDGRRGDQVAVEELEEEEEVEEDAGEGGRSRVSTSDIEPRPALPAITFSNITGCRCHGHARRCVWVAGAPACLSCRHDTWGRHCELCRPGFYRNEGTALADSDTCRDCLCDPLGSLHERCDAAGRCTCLPGATGRTCAHCLRGFHWNGGCRVNVCDEALLRCRNGGACQENRRCWCPERFAGSHCQADLCPDDPVGPVDPAGPGGYGGRRRKRGPNGICWNRAAALHASGTAVVIAVTALPLCWGL